MLFRRALLFMCLALAVSGTGLAAVHTPDQKTVVNAQANDNTGDAVEPAHETTTTGLAPETTTTTSSVRPARPRKIGGLDSELPALGRGLGAPSSDPCAAALVDEDVATANDEGTYEIDRSTGALRLVARSHGIAVYNPDGVHVAYVIDATTQPRMCLANRVTKQARTLFVGNFIQASVPNFPTRWATANLLVFAQIDSQNPHMELSGFSVFRYDLLTSQVTRIAAAVSAFAVSPSGRFVAYAVPTGKTPNQPWTTGSLYVVRVVGGQPRLVFSNPSAAVTEVRWSHDEDTVAIGDPLYLVDVASGDATMRSACGDGAFGGVWSPVDSRFAFASSFDPSRSVCAITPDTSEATELGFGGRPEDWSPDGDHLLLNALTDFSSTHLTTVLSELTLANHQTRKLFSFVSSANEPHFFDAEYSPDGKTIRFSNKVAI